MHLRRLEIERFRGIRHLDWRHIGDAVALVGTGDAGKSSILDAIERVLSPRWNLSFDDADFFELRTAEPIVIRATITDVPAALYRDTKFGLALQEFHEHEGVAKPVTGEAESYALVVELRVDGSLEPSWNVIDGSDRPHLFLARDREALGMLRVGSFVDMHLGWSRGSVLSRLTESGDSVGAVLAAATRQARANVKMDGLDRLTQAAGKVEQVARNFGVAPRTGLAPNLDVASLQVAAGALSLHDGDVPLRRAGTGTRRLLAIAMQREAAADVGLTIVDEFEHGLEPHRIRRLLRVLRGKPPEKRAASGQLILTTHSPTVLSELAADEVFVTRRAPDGSVAVACLDRSLEYLLPRVPDALLARSVVVAEGITEVGLCLALDESWSAETGESFAYRGVGIVDGLGGDQPATSALHLVKLGYRVALLVDSDAKAKTGRAAGATILAWPGGVCTEQRLALDLPIEGVREMTALAAASPKVGDPRRVRDALADAMPQPRTSFGDDPRAWIDVADEARFREKLGSVAHNKGWFKSKSLGEALGRLVTAHWSALEGKPTRAVLEQLQSFVGHA